MTDFLSRISRSRVLPVLVISAVIAIGTVMLLQSRAATPAVSLEAESGSITSPASSFNDTAASGGSAVSFRAPATPSGGFTFAALGDIGGNAEDTVMSLKAIGASPASAFTLALGDMSYSDITPESAWCTFVKNNVGSTHPFEVISGNHEEDGGPDGHISNFKACLPDRLNSKGVYGAEYYFDYPAAQPLARVIMIGADLRIDGVTYDYFTGNARYNWLSGAIDSARSAGIPWVIVGMHKVCVSIGNKDCSVGQQLTDLLMNKKVDLILSGHDHDYQRTKQLRCAKAGTYDPACVVDASADNVYAKGAGPVWVVQGMGGGGAFTEVIKTDTEAGYFAAAMGGTNGYNLVTNTTTAAVTKGIMKYTITSTELKGTLVPAYIVPSRTGTLFSDQFTVN